MNKCATLLFQLNDMYMYPSMCKSYFLLLLCYYNYLTDQHSVCACVCVCGVCVCVCVGACVRGICRCCSAREVCDMHLVMSHPRKSSAPGWQ